MRQIQRAFLTAILLPFTAAAVWSGPVVPAPALIKQYPPAERKVILDGKDLMGIRFTQDGRALYLRKSILAEKGVEVELQEKALRTVLLFLSKLPPEDPEAGMTLALKSFMGPRMTPEQMAESPFMALDEKGELRITDIGKNALMDILMATNGELLEPLVEIEKPKTKGGPIMCTEEAKAAGACLAPPMSAGGLKSLDKRRALMKNADAAFDGARHRLGGFDWNDLGDAVSAAGGLKGFSPSETLEGYAFNKEKGTVRVLIAGDKAVKRDRFKASDAASGQSEIYEQTGLDEELFKAHGAKVVRAVDNIVAVDVSIEEAAALGQALEKRGVESRPARVYRAVKTALTDGIGSLMGTGLLPLATGGKESKGVTAKLAEGVIQVGADGMRKAGMKGKGALVGVIDSGIDMDHPDFKDEKGNSRVQGYMDFTGEGTDDVVGHGTHVSGILGGNGAASKGKYTGMSTEARFKVAKVFGEKGETDESVILAAMKWMATGEKPEERVDLINMSLGGPGAANHDPLGSMANHLVVKNNILVVGAAGNEGPFSGSVGSPGNARYVLTVGGVDKEGKPAFFSSRGPIRDEDGNLLYNKPDIVGVSGNVDLSKLEAEVLKGIIMVSPEGKLQSVAGPKSDRCIYSPGIIAPRSGKDPDSICAVEGNPGYRYMSGTSQATPMTAGFAANVIGYAKANGAEYSALQLKALMMETAKDLGHKKEFQGAGLIRGDTLAQTVSDRVKRGLPIGNIAFALAMRMTSHDLDKLKMQKRYKMTPLGLLDTKTGHLIRSETEMERVLKQLRSTTRV